MNLQSKIVLLTAFSSLVLAFQNCTPAPQGVKFSQASESLRSDGNGQGYDGKIYLVNGDVCPDSTRIHSKIILKSEKLGSLVRENCQDITPISLDNKQFQVSPTNPDELTYLSQIFVAQVPFGGVILNLSSAFAYSGFRYALYFNFGTPADTSAALSQSRLQLFENGISLGPAHSVHQDIADFGQGRFSHWSDTTGEQIFFSASDNTSPLNNGRVYSYKIGL